MTLNPIIYLGIDDGIELFMVHLGIKIINQKLLLSVKKKTLKI